MKLLLFTSQGISRKLTEFFARRKDVELTVVTQSTVRDRIYGYEPVAPYCEKQGIPCWQPKKLDDAFMEKARAFKPDLIVAAYFPQIFPPALLTLAPLGAYNVHPGDLPRYRGTFAIPWMILNGETELTVTLHEIDAKVDTGRVLARRRSPIGPEETGFELYGRAMHQSADLLMDSFDALAAGKLPREAQAGHGSYFNRIEPRLRIDWHQPREQVRRQVRVHAKPYLPAHSYLINRCLYIDKASPVDAGAATAQGAGFIAKVYPDKTFAVACADGWLKVEKYDVYPPLDDAQFALHFAEGARLD